MGHVLYIPKNANKTPDQRFCFQLLLLSTAFVMMNFWWQVWQFFCSEIQRRNEELRLQSLSNRMSAKVKIRQQKIALNNSLLLIDLAFSIISFKVLSCRNFGASCEPSWTSRIFANAFLKISDYSTVESLPC